MKTLTDKLLHVAGKPNNIILLLIRLTLAYGFYLHAKMKWSDMQAIAKWFGSMHYPFPLASAYLAGTTEAIGVLLLAIGWGTRIISVPLIILLLVAIFTVHITHGFNAGNHGFEIPLYYILMLLTLISFGAGKFSVDNLISKKK